MPTISSWFLVNSNLGKYCNILDFDWTNFFFFFFFFVLKMNEMFWPKKDLKDKVAEVGYHQEHTGGI